MSTEINVIIPPGKIGIRMKDFSSDVSSTVVTSVSPNSPLAGKVFKGDHIIYVNGVDVRKMNTSEILKLFQKFSNKEKVITFALENVLEDKNQKGDPTFTKDKFLSLSMGSEPTQSTKTSTEYECTYCDRSPHCHHKENRNFTPHLNESLAPPTKDLKVEIIHDDVNDERPFSSYKNSSETKSRKYARLTPMTSNEDDSPVPTAFLDRSMSEASCSTQKSPSMTICPIEDRSPSHALIQPCFVFDDSIASMSSMKAKLYNAASPAQNIRIVKAHDDLGELPPSNHEVSPQLADEGYSTLLSNQRSSPSHWSHYPSNNARLHSVAQPSLSPETIIQSATSSRSSHSFHSSLSGVVMDEPTNEHFEVIADAVVVNDPEVYDAELMHCEEAQSNNGTKTPHILINNMYSLPDDKQPYKRQGLQDSKFSSRTSLLIAIIVGCGLMATGVVLGMKKSTSNSTTSNNIMAYTGSSQSTTDDHSQTYTVIYNDITGHYYIVYKNRTVDVGSTLPACPNVSVDNDFATVNSPFNSSTMKYWALSDVRSTDQGYNASLTTECLKEYFENYLDDYNKSTLSTSSPYVTTTTSTIPPITILDYPPSDLEGRCSASNLPGSLSACLTACRPSACCYPDFNGETCLKNSLCSLYRPYCDVFYDPWIDSTSGVLKAVTEEMFSTCTRMNATKFSQRLSPAYTNQVIELLPNTSLEVNWLRGHLSPENITSLASTNTVNIPHSTSTEEACQQHCISAKCCFAAVITDPKSSGLVLSLTGVFTNFSNGEYVMTNCQNTTRENLQLCTKYHKLCSSDTLTIDGETGSSIPTHLNESKTGGKTPTPVLVSGNDKCEDAFPFKILPASFVGDTIVATPDFTSTLEPLCGTSIESKGVWYSFESDKRRVVRLEYNLTFQRTGDSVLSIFTGSCAAGSLSCVENVTGTGYSYFSSDQRNAIYEFLSEVGKTYHFLLSGANGDTAGEYEFRVTEYDIPTNDVCGNATKIVTIPQESLKFKGDTRGATPDFNKTNVDIQDCADTDWYTRGLWYQMIGKGTHVRLEYHMSLFTQPDLDLGNSELSIFTGTCEDLLCYDNSEGHFSDDSYSVVSHHEMLAKEGETYLFLLHGADFQTASEFELIITEYDVPNDECSKATQVAVSPSTPFVKNGLSTLGATPDFIQSDRDSCGVNWYAQGVWYHVIGKDSVLRMEYKLYSAGIEMAIFTGSCNSLSCYSTVQDTIENNEQATDDYYWGGNNELVAYEFFAEKSKSYFVWLSGENFSASATYDFTVSEFEIPSNDKCENATTIFHGPIYTGKTSGSTPDFNASNEKCGGTENNYGVWYSFTGNGMLNYFSYTPPQSYNDSQLSLFGGSCDTLICEKNYGTETSFSFLSVRGRAYHLFLAANSLDTVGDFSLSVEQYERPSNDACVNALEVTIFPYEVKENMKGATPDFDDETVKCGEDPLYSGVWYSFVGTGKEFTLELKTAGTSSDFWGEIAVFKGKCDKLECIIQHESTGENAIVNASVPSITGVQYYVLIANLGLPTYDVFFQFTVSEEDL